MAVDVIDEFVALLGYQVDDSGVKQWEKSAESSAKNVLKTLGGAAKTMAKLGAAGAAAFLGNVALTSHGIRELSATANALNVSDEFLGDLGGVVKQLGLETDVASDLIEELNNKIGESKGLEATTPVIEAMQILGLEFEKISKLNPEEQFIAVADAAARLGDQQAAVSAADILLGGEGNKVIGYIRDQEASTRDLLAAQRALDFQTERSREGGEGIAKTFAQLGALTSNLNKLIVGLAGEALGPMVSKLIEWSTANKALIQSEVTEFFDNLPGHLREAWRWLKLVGLAVTALGIAFAVNVAGGAAATIIKAITAISTAYKALAASAIFANASVLLLPLAVLAVGVIFAAVANDIYHFATGGKSVLGDFVDWVKKEFPVLGGVIDIVGAAFKTVTDLAEAAFKTGMGDAEGAAEIMDSVAARFAKAFAVIRSALSPLLDGLAKLAAPITSVISQFSSTAAQPPAAALSPYGGSAIPALLAAPVAGGATHTDNSTVSINVTQRAGESNADLAKRIKAEFRQQAGAAARNADSGVAA